MEHLAKALIIFAVMGTFAFIIWIASRALPDRKKVAFDAHKMLLDKFQSTEELNKFLSTEAGTTLVGRLGGDGDAPALESHPLAAILALVVLGFTGIGVGLAFLLLTKFNAQPDMIAPAIVVTIPSLGLLIGAAVSYHLKKKWGLLKRDPSAPEA